MNKIRKRYFFVIAMFCLLFACNNKSEIKSVVKNWQGKHFILPEDSLMVDAFGSKINPLSKKQKIITSINASRGACICELNDWMIFMQEIDTSKVEIIFLLYSIDDLITFDKINDLHVNFTYPYFNDKNKNILKMNNFSEELNYHTFLLDSTNRVVLVGNPIKSKELAALYKKEIKRASTSQIQSNHDSNVSTIYKNNMAYLHFNDDVIFINENGKVVTDKEIKEMYEKYQIYFEQTASTQITVRIVKPRDPN